MKTATAIVINNGEITMITNGFGEQIYNPEAYFRAVEEDRYGFSSNNNSHYNNFENDYDAGYVDGYSDGYSDACDDCGDYGW